jgi:hypothetical protein
MCASCVIAASGGHDGKAEPASGLGLSHVVGEERHGGTAGPPGRREVKSVEGPNTGDLGDVCGRVAGDAVQLDYREDGDVLEERAVSRVGSLWRNASASSESGSSMYRLSSALEST